MIFVRNAGEEEEMAVFTKGKKSGNYPEDSERAKRKTSGNIYKANLGLGTLIPMSLLS